MATDWAADVKKYDPDDAVIAGISRYCGKALDRDRRGAGLARAV